MHSQTKNKKNYPKDPEVTELLSLLKRNRFQPKKRLGQTFLCKQSIAAEIVHLSEIKSHDLVVEIGAGLGALTHLIAESAAKVIALEYDTALVSILQKIVTHKNVEIIRADALNFDYKKVFNQHKSKLKIIGNLPYYMTSPLIFKLLKFTSFIDSITVMMQKEVADRVAAQPGKKDYGTISIFSQLFCDISKELTVSKDCFYPIPKVDSEVLKFTMLERPVVEINDVQFFEKLIRASFSQRRKTLLNSLKGASFFNRDKQKILEALKNSGIDPQRRPETLTIDEFNTLSQQITSIKPLPPR